MFCRKCLSLEKQLDLNTHLAKYTHNVLLQLFFRHVFFPFAKRISGIDTATKKMYIVVRFSLFRRHFRTAQFFPHNLQISSDHGAVLFFHVICFEGEKRWDKVPPLQCLWRDLGFRGLLSCENKNCWGELMRSFFPQVQAAARTFKDWTLHQPPLIWTSSFT